MRSLRGRLRSGLQGSGAARSGGGDPGAPTRVLVLRPDNLGDAVLFSGAFRHIRAFYPGAEITVCVRRYVANLLERSPHIDRLLMWEDLAPPLPWKAPFRGRRRVEDLWIRLRAALLHRFDTVLVPLRSPTHLMHVVAGAVGADERIGIVGDLSNQVPEDDQQARRLYTSFLEMTPAREQGAEAEVTRDFVRLLGGDVATSDLWPEFWTDDADRLWAERHVASSGGDVLLGIAPGVSSRPAKRYPAERLAESIAALKDCTMDVVLFGGAAESDACNETAALLMRLPNVKSVANLASRSSVRQLVEGLRRCDLVLSEETAALHIATALHKPTVGILGGGHYGRFYPWGDPVSNRVVNRWKECYGCNWMCPFESIRCIQEISPHQITHELQSLLSTLPSSVSEGAGGGC